jgi:hypothetical protein
VNGQKYISNHATIWRWRDAFQNDFAARMQWTLGKDPSYCNHAPVPIINDSAIGPNPLHIDAEAGSIITLDASQSYDPDDDDITFGWFQYSDVTASQWWVAAEVQSCKIEDQDTEKSGRVVSIQLPPPDKCAIDMFSGEPQEMGQVLHFILEVRDNGTPQLRSYKRVVVQITNKELRGRREQAVESIADVHGFDGT